MAQWDHKKMLKCELNELKWLL